MSAIYRRAEDIRKEPSRVRGLRRLDTATTHTLERVDTRSGGGVRGQQYQTCGSSLSDWSRDGELYTHVTDDSSTLTNRKPFISSME